MHFSSIEREQNILNVPVKQGVLQGVLPRRGGLRGQTNQTESARSGIYTKFKFTLHPHVCCLNVRVANLTVNTKHRGSPPSDTGVMEHSICRLREGRNAPLLTGRLPASA